MTTPITFLIRQLNDGGAQRQLVELVRRLDSTRYRITVITLYDEGRFVEELLQIPFVNYASLAKKSRWDVIGSLYRLLCELRKSKPRILHGYLGLANILCVLFKPFFPDTLIVWGIRASTLDLDRYDWLFRVLYRIERALSRFADLIIVNSDAGYRYALQNGFPAERMVTIPNGFDTERFLPDPVARCRVRQGWGIGSDAKVIGIVGRLDPLKDFPTFLRASALLNSEQKDVYFVCVGDGEPNYSKSLHALGEQLGLAGKLIWAGARCDMSAVYNAFDVLSLSSITEGFPNVVGEAMACGVPCVVTDVGDVGLLVGDTGFVVPPCDPKALKEGFAKMLSKIRKEFPPIGQQARQRIVDCFSTSALANNTDRVLSGMR